MILKNELTKLLNIEYPIIMAPMFLVSNYKMIEQALQCGIAGCFPSLNYRNEGELEAIIRRLKEIKNPTGNWGVNLIVQKSNPLYQKHLKICIENETPFFITSLGNPKEVIELAHSYGGKVLCDVTNIEHAKKVNDLGCDGFIAVTQGAGGHAGPHPMNVLVPVLKQTFPNKIVIAAGGIADGQGILSAMCLGAEGVSIGTRFINSTEAEVNNSYKEAIVNAQMDDIVMTTKLSGTPCSIINTPYAKSIGYDQNFLEKMLSKNPKTKKYFKMLVQFRGMKKLEQSIMPNNYKTLWSAGKSSALINDIKSVKAIVEQLNLELKNSLNSLNSKFN